MTFSGTNRPDESTSQTVLDSPARRSWRFNAAFPYPGHAAGGSGSVNSSPDASFTAGELGTLAKVAHVRAFEAHLKASHEE